MSAPDYSALSYSINERAHPPAQTEFRPGTGRTCTPRQAVNPGPCGRGIDESTGFRLYGVIRPLRRSSCSKAPDASDALSTSVRGRTSHRRPAEER